jgi:hypothetical protein
MSWRHLGLCLATAFPAVWLAWSAGFGLAWATALALLLGSVQRASVRIPGLCLLYVPAAALCLLPIPDVFHTRSLADPPPLSTVVPLVNLAIALTLVGLSVRFTLAPALYVSAAAPALGAAFARSRELYRGHATLFLPVALLPAGLAAAGVGALALSRGNLGRPWLEPATAETLASVTGLACLALAPTLAAALKVAALRIAAGPTDGTASAR